MVLISAAPEGRVLLENVRWSTFQALITDLGPRRGRVTYDRGTLEIMSPSKKHERLKMLLARFIMLFTQERAIKVQSTGSVTLEREDLDRGVEADDTYYVVREPEVRDQEDLDLGRDPPPDIAVEVEVTKSFLDREDIYAALGVPEVWRCDGNDITVHRLGKDGRYRRAPRSAVLPGFPLAAAVRLLRKRGKLDDTSLGIQFLALLRKNRGRRE
jgi:Uma2 family endonuclease